MKKTTATLLACLTAALMLFAVGCKESADDKTTLFDLRDEYGAKMVDHAKSVNGFWGDVSFRCVVMDRDVVLSSLPNYIFSPALDESKVVKGIGVEASFPDGQPVYMLYGLEFSEEMQSDLSVSLQISPQEVFVYERVKDNRKILFEYEVLS